MEIARTVGTVSVVVCQLIMYSDLIASVTSFLLSRSIGSCKLLSVCCWVRACL